VGDASALKRAATAVSTRSPYAIGEHQEAHHNFRDNYTGSSRYFVAYVEVLLDVPSGHGLNLQIHGLADARVGAVASGASRLGERVNSGVPFVGWNVPVSIDGRGARRLVAQSTARPGQSP
jgi:hypothetical protein